MRQTEMHLKTFKPPHLEAGSKSLYTVGSGSSHSIAIRETSVFLFHFCGNDKKENPSDKTTQYKDSNLK